MHDRSHARGVGSGSCKQSDVTLGKDPLTQPATGEGLAAILEGNMPARYLHAHIADHMTSLGSFFGACSDSSYGFLVLLPIGIHQ